MMNINIVPPAPGYLERVRELCAQHGVDADLRRGQDRRAIAAGGATELFGVTPDVVCLAKAICGGYPGGAVGMTDALAELVADGRVRQHGHLQRQPARDGRRRGDADRGAHRRRLRAAAGDQRAR